MEPKKLTFTQKRELIKMLKEAMNAGRIAKQLKISEALLSYIIKGERKDKVGAIEYIYSNIENVINDIFNNKEPKQ